MTLYRLYLTDKSGHPAGWKPLGFVSSVKARNSAMAALRQRPDLSGVEVWRDGDLAFRVRRLSLAAPDEQH